MSREQQQQQQQQADSLPWSGTIASRLGAALLVVLVLLSFGVSVQYGLISWDDYDSISENPRLARFGWEQLRWAWTSSHMGVYQPLAWMLLGLEWRLFHGHPGMLHLVSLVLHGLQALVLWRLLAALLRRALPDATHLGRELSSWAAAAFFAVHPLRTEPVVWVSGQPYLPSALFFTLSLLVYLRAQDEQRSASSRQRAIILSLACFLAAGLFKAVALTLPLVLVVLDFFPLRRLGGERGWLGAPVRGVWIEKLPFLTVGAATAALAVWSKGASESLVPWSQAGLGDRIAQAAYGAWFYVSKTIFPWPLHAYYVLPRRPNLGEGIYLQCLGAVVIIVVAAVFLRRRWPWLAAAVAAYLIILLPNLGLVTFGAQISADRYSYLASLPLVALAAGTLCRFGPRARSPARLAAAVSLVLAALTLLSWRQTTTWKSPEALWSHVIRHGGINWISHTNLGQALAEKGHKQEAMNQYLAAHRLAPHEAITNANLATAFADFGQLEKARRLFEQAVRLKPHAVPYFGLGTTLSRLGHNDLAADAFRRGIALQPDHADTLTNLGVLELGRGRVVEGRALLERALSVTPEHAIARFNLGMLLFNQGDLEGAIAQYRRALSARPDMAGARAALTEAIAAQSSAARRLPKPPTSH